jgi:hypothetical protein
VILNPYSNEVGSHLFERSITYSHQWWSHGTTSPPSKRELQEPAQTNRISICGPIQQWSPRYCQLVCSMQPSFRPKVSCGDRSKLQELVSIVTSFQLFSVSSKTTTAAWPKWGSLRECLDTKAPQRLPLPTCARVYFQRDCLGRPGWRNNNTAMVMAIIFSSVQHTYWLTPWSRPDHRGKVDVKKQGIQPRSVTGSVQYVGVSGP